MGFEYGVERMGILRPIRFYPDPQKHMHRSLVNIRQAHPGFGAYPLDQGSSFADDYALLGFPFYHDVGENPNLRLLNFDIFDMHVQGMGHFFLEQQVRAFPDDFPDPVVYRGIRIVFGIE